MMMKTRMELRMECLKVATHLVAQMKDPKMSALELARQYYKFVIGEDIDPYAHVGAGSSPAQEAEIGTPDVPVPRGVGGIRAA